jgi:hypothetical protein
VRLVNVGPLRRGHPRSGSSGRSTTRVRTRVFGNPERVAFSMVSAERCRIRPAPKSENLGHNVTQNTPL